MSVISSSIAIISNLLELSAKGTLDVYESKNLEKINEEANKQGLELQMAHAQAKVAQEIAIAQRIENATEVVIEEYYADEKIAEAGAKMNEAGLAINLSGESRKITKRIYRFVGNTEKNDGKV